MIILVRHAQSEGNSKCSIDVQSHQPYLYLTAPENRDIHQTVPDHRVELTQDGWKQVGSKIRATP